MAGDTTKLSERIHALAKNSDTAWYESLAAEVAALERALDEAVALNATCVCSFCGATGARTIQYMAEHAASCEKHPMKAMSDTLDRLRAQLAAAQRVVEAADKSRFGPPGGHTSIVYVQALNAALDAYDAARSAEGANASAAGTAQGEPDWRKIARNWLLIRADLHCETTDTPERRAHAETCRYLALLLGNELAREVAHQPKAQGEPSPTRHGGMVVDPSGEWPPRCEREACGKLLDRRGSLVWLPTENPRLFEKFHLCADCGNEAHRLAGLPDRLAAALGSAAGKEK